jgi:hypothetical protein
MPYLHIVATFLENSIFVKLAGPTLFVLSLVSLCRVWNNNVMLISGVTPIYNVITSIIKI